MRQEKLAPEAVLRTYMGVLSEAILNARMRIRYGAGQRVGVRGK